MASLATWPCAHRHQNGAESPNGDVDHGGKADRGREDELALAGGRLMYDSDDEKELNPNFLETDDFRQCDFELGGVAGAAVDNAIGLLSAPWMDVTLNLIIAINGILDVLRGGRACVL